MKLRFIEVLLLLLLIFLISVTLIGAAYDQRILFGLIIATLTALIVVPILSKLRKGLFDIFEPVVFFSILYLFFHVIKSIDVYYLGGSLVVPKSIMSNITAIGYALIGYIFFILGYYLRLGEAISRKIPAVTRPKGYNHVTLIYLSMMTVGVISFILLTYERGFINYITSLNERVRFFSNRGIYYYFLLFIPVSFLFWYTATIKRQFSFKGWLTGMFFLLSLLGTVCIGSRLNVIMLILGVLVIRHYMYKRVNIRFMSFVGIAIIIFLIFGGYLRRQGADIAGKVRSGIERDVVSENIFINSFHMINRRFVPHEELIILVDNMPEELNFQYGRTYLSMFFHFVPKALIGRERTKRFNMGRIFTSTFFPKLEKEGLATFSPGILGEGYLNFHVLGIIISMFVFGLSYRILYSYLKFDVSSAPRVLIYAILLPGMAKIVKGGFVSAAKLFLGLFVPIIIGIFLMEQFKSKEMPVGIDKL